jgi:Uncharacterised protein family UPF0547.
LVGNFPHFTREGYDLIGDNEFELHYSKVTTKKGAPKYKVCPNCEELVPLGTHVCECGHEFWKKGMPQEERGELQEWFPKKAPSPFTEEQLADFAQMYRNGESTIAIANKYSRGVTSVGKALRRMGMKMRTKLEAHGDNYSEEQLSVYAKRYENGETFQQIADSVGVNKRTLWQVLKSRGVVARAGACRIIGSSEKENVKSECVRMLNAGNSHPQISKALGISETTVGEIKKKLGVRLPSQAETLLKKDRAVIDAINNGLSSEEVLSVFGYGSEGVRKAKKRLGIDDPNDKRKLLAQETREMATMYESGMSTMEIARRLDKDPGSTYTRLRKFGVAMRNRGEATSMAMNRYSEAGSSSCKMTAVTGNN